MDTTKWRTVAIRIDSYKLLKGLCDKTHRNPANMISKLIDSHLTYLCKKEQIKLDDLKNQLCKDQK